MKAIVCTSCNWKIGNAGKLLFDIPEDRRMFRYHTTSIDWTYTPCWHPQMPIVIMGRKTYESLPGKRPLPNRINWILSDSLKGSDPEGFKVVSLSDILRPCYVENPNVWVIGGAEVYRTLAPYCSHFYITCVNQHIEDSNADTAMFDIHRSIDPNVSCEIASSSAWYEFKHNGENVQYRFAVYRNYKRIRMYTSDEQTVSR